MVLALLWLTVSIPFVYAAKQVQAKYEKMAMSSPDMPLNEEEAANPFGSTTEEKAPGGGTISINEEFLHDHHQSEYFFAIKSQYHKCENADTYLAFHGELLVPPPNAA